MNKTNENMYVIPAKYRKMENMHIVFWLFKDISWCMIWKLLGVIMIIPTLLIAIFISWRTRKIKSELAHNLAVTFWISANSYWMISEFFHFDAVKIIESIEGKHLSIIPFAIGMLILAYYYIFQKQTEIEDHHLVTM